jgi:thioredoxin reductase
MDNKRFDVIILGGSYAGLSAAMALGRALRKVLIIEGGLPCNRQTPHSHNFLTQDGKTPAEITLLAKEQVLQYDTILFHQATAVSGIKTEMGFEVVTASNERFTAKKLLFATGIKDILPDIDGFAECWGISAIHCPYCHGYEYRNERTGILAHGDTGFDLAKLISNWTKDLFVFTGGESVFTDEQLKMLKQYKIQVLENEVERFVHIAGQLQHVVLKDNSIVRLKAVYARLPFEQHSTIPVDLGCELTEQGYLKVDSWQKTTIYGIYACGDNSTPMRSVSNAVFTGSVAGAAINKELIEEIFRYKFQYQSK